MQYPTAGFHMPIQAWELLYRLGACLRVIAEICDQWSSRGFVVWGLTAFVWWLYVFARWDVCPDVCLGISPRPLVVVARLIGQVGIKGYWNGILFPQMWSVGIWSPPRTHKNASITDKTSGTINLEMCTWLEGSTLCLVRMSTFSNHHCELTLHCYIITIKLAIYVEQDKVRTTLQCGMFAWPLFL